MKKSFRFFVLFFILLFNFKYLIHANLLEPFEYPKIVKKIEIYFTHLNSNDMVNWINNRLIPFKDFVIDCSAIDGAIVYKPDPTNATHGTHYFNEIKACFGNVNIFDLRDPNGRLITLVVNFLCSLCKVYKLNYSDIYLNRFSSSDGSDEYILSIVPYNHIQNSVKEKLDKSSRTITLHKFLGTSQEFHKIFGDFKINIIGFSKYGQFIYPNNYISGRNCAIIFYDESYPKSDDESYPTSDDCIRLSFYNMLIAPKFVNMLFNYKSCFSPTDITNVSQLFLDDYIRVSPQFPSLVSFDSVKAIANAVKTLGLGIVYF